MNNLYKILGTAAVASGFFYFFIVFESIESAFRFMFALLLIYAGKKTYSFSRKNTEPNIYTYLILGATIILLGSVAEQIISYILSNT